MPLDGTVVSNITTELKEKLLNSKIDKIYQPEDDEIILIVRANDTNYKLLLTCNTNYPRIHITNAKKQNPQNAPMFCMFLRKHLTNSKIIDIVQPEFERIIEIHTLSKDQIGDKTFKKLIIEIMGRHSNIILVDQNNKVLDSIKHITDQISSIRQVYPGTDYFMPPTKKVNPLCVDYNFFYNNFSQASDESLVKMLLHNFMGFGKVLSNELVYRYSLVCDSYEPDVEKLWTEFSKVINKVKNNEFTPTLYTEPETDNPVDFSSINLMQYPQYKSVNFESISNLIEQFYGEKDRRIRLKHKMESIIKNIQKIIDRKNRKISNLNQVLIDAKDKEKYKVWGDLIFANIYKIEKQDDTLSTINFFSESQEILEIPLDPQLTPAENAQKYYKKYNKLKNAEKSSLQVIAETDEEVKYLESVLNNIENCYSDDDIQQIKNELQEQGYLKKNKKTKKKNDIKSKPLSFTSSDGFKMYVGKNNAQNDELTLKIANKSDIWLHTKTIHGSHVIIRTNNQEIPENTLLEAASLAAYYSKAKNSINVEIDYTTVKNVKKPSGAKPGMVTYYNYKTLVVNPNVEIVNKLKNTSE